MAQPQFRERVGYLAHVLACPVKTFEQASKPEQCLALLGGTPAVLRVCPTETNVRTVFDLGREHQNELNVLISPIEYGVCVLDRPE